MKPDETSPKKEGEKDTTEKKVTEIIHSVMPKPPGTQGQLPETPKSEAPKMEIPKTETPKEDKSTASKKKDAPSPAPKKDRTFLVIAGIFAAIIVALLVVISRPTPKAQETPKNVDQAQYDLLLSRIQTAEINATDYKTKFATLKAEVDALSTQLKTYQSTTDATLALAKGATASSKENRQYISTIYQEVLNLKLRMENIGGGYSAPIKTQPDERTINPYIGNSELP